MEGEKENCSTFYVPGAMSDVTLLSTPLPQAASTATKRQSVMEQEEDNTVEGARERFHKEFEEFCQESTPYDYGSGGLIATQLQQLMEMDKRRTRECEPAMKPNNADPRVSDYDCRVSSAPVPNFYYPTDQMPNYCAPRCPVSSVSNSGTKLWNQCNTDIQKNPSPRGSNINTVQISSVPVPRKSNSGTNTGNEYNVHVQKIKSPRSLEVDAVEIFCVPGPRNSNSGINTGNKSNADVQERKSPRTSDIDAVKIPSVPSSPRISHNFSNRDTLGIASDKLTLSAGLSKFLSSRDLTQHRDDRVSVASLVNLRDQTRHRDDRISVASSANSSLGVIPSDVLDDAHREPLVDVRQNLGRELAQKLNLDTSMLKDGMDVSTLYSERSKEKAAAKREDNKENQRNSGRRSSDYWTIHGYSSDNSDSKNNTAKRLSALSTGSGGETESSNKSSSFSRRSLRPLSEMNFSTSHPSSNSMSGRSSVGSNPFGSYSNVSVASEDFQSGEDAMQRLQRDERQFSMASSRSLSGIYGDTSFSVNVNGEKLSMSSFLRSGSYPLGSLETGYGDSQSPQFGMPSKSPEKTGKPRAILPPPQDKSTFLVEEEPVRDTPWGPNSLMEQYSNIHNTTDMTDADFSVPSLSYIGEMLEKMHQGATQDEILAQLMASKSKRKNKPEDSLKPNRISSVVEGENSFCQGIEAERSFAAKDRSGLQYLSVGASRVESVCNITDFEGDDEACVCVMTPQSMDFDIFNELSHPAEYSFTKACYVDGIRRDSAAYVNFSVSRLMLYPGQKRTLTINIAALVAGVIKIKIEVTRKNPLTQVRECSSVYGKIVAEIPKVLLMTQHEDEMTPNPDCEYDGKYQHTIVMKNEGRSTVPLKLTVTKMADDDDIEFNFGEREKQTATVMVEPGQILRQLVQCETPPVFAHLQPPETITPVKARVVFCLATTDLYQLTPIAPVMLVAPLKPYFFGAPPVLVVPTILSLYNSCDQPAVFKSHVQGGYTVRPSSFIIPPDETFVVTVGTAKTKDPLGCGKLTLRVPYPMGTESFYTIQLREDCGSSISSSNSLATPFSSRAPSPTSPSSSLGAPVGELKVACSQKQLVWGGCHLHQRVVKSFCLKNMGRQREKLRLTISDKCFKIVGEEDTLQTELKLSLQPSEFRGIKVAVLATVAGPLWGHLTVSRISCAADKNVLPLFAFGGKPEVNLTQGVFEVEANKYIFLDENTLQGSFSLSNSGDNAAFFRISEANSKSSAGLSISPPEGLLVAGRTVTIHISLSITAKRLEYLLRQSTPSVSVAQLSIHWGDESTRQRLLRMEGLHGVLAARVLQLSRIPSCPITNLDKLGGSVNGAEGLWEEDTDEWTVGVYVKRSALEALRLDTSDDLVDLSRTVSKPLH